MTRLTKREWRDVVMPRPWNSDAVRVLEAIEAMIDRGETWAPEPVTEADVLRWLRGWEPGAGEGAQITKDDLALAMERCYLNGVSPRIKWVSPSWRAAPDAESGTYRSAADLSSAARIFATWAYKRAHPNADVTHLLGDES